MHRAKLGMRSGGNLCLVSERNIQERRVFSTTLARKKVIYQCCLGVIGEKDKNAYKQGIWVQKQ